MPRDDNKLTMKQIEELEHKYLEKYWHFLKFVEDEIIIGFNTKYDIESDWIGKYGTENGGTSDFAVGSERIIYALLNGKVAGQPNSCPVSSDLFFEIDDAYVHIDLKSVLTSGGDAVSQKTGEPINDNIGDFDNSIFIGRNQNSYKGTMIVTRGANAGPREYVPNLPPVYSKSNGDKKIALTYFITILSNSSTFDTEMVTIMCMPNGKLEPHYGTRPLKAGKNPDKTRFNCKEVCKFELLEGQPSRIKIVYCNPKMNDWTKKKLSFYRSLI